MYLVLLWNALAHPHQTMNKIVCDHPEDLLHSQLLDAGMRKMWWCEACDATWFSTGTAA